MYRHQIAGLDWEERLHHVFFPVSSPYPSTRFTGLEQQISSFTENARLVGAAPPTGGQD